MDHGARNRMVQFRRAAQVFDGLSTTDVWSDYGDAVWASKSDISDGERWRAGAVAANITTRFSVRYSGFAATITPVDRLTCEGREYDISGVKEIGRREGFEITAAARSDQ